MTKKKLTPEQAWGMNGLMATAAVRYCLGRMTYLTHVCSEWLIANWDSLPDTARQGIQKDVEENFREDDEARRRGDQYKPLGWDCDRQEWDRVRMLWKTEKTND